MNNNEYIPWFILLNPLVTAVLILVALRKNHGTAAAISTLSAFFGIVGSLCAFSLPKLHSAFEWISVGSLTVPIGVQVDQLSQVMLLVVTGIGFLVHLYSTVYMEHDESKARFFGHLSLFMFSMLGIVLADNFAMMFIFWELVGVSSYLLIGHWFTRDAAGKAANKAFMMNRIGDFGFMLGILMLWSTAGTVTFEGLASPSSVAALTQNSVFLATAILLVFCGTLGKSAQFPLHTWLPDAMEGPTPVSALIHAATMVAAGVFMLARIAFLIGLSAHAALVISWVGGVTALLAALMLWSTAGTVTFKGLEAAQASLTANPVFLATAILLVFCGTLGKSAQFPLHTWLPDAMEGPTPVSALIHAATMVAAGVFMLARITFLIDDSAHAMLVISWVGGVTALLAALMATQQDDIKRILAYSTLSQLGYMVMAIGLAPDANGGPAMFHLFTHAFFKALLFLGAGAVIHALHHEQNIWKMGGLSKHMPKTTVTFAIGTAALTGFPLLAGFWSKDSILAAASEKSTPLYIIGLCVAVLTAFYMTRLFVVAFLGKPRTEAAHHGHDCPARMTVPLLILAVLSVIAGFVPEKWFFSAHQHFHWNIAIPATIAFAVGTAFAFSVYNGKDKDPISVSAFRNKFYFDEIYGAIVAGTQDVLAYIANAIDGIISGIVRLAGMAAWGTGFVFRLLQFGNVQGYSFVFGLGVVGLIYYVVFR